TDDRKRVEVSTVVVPVLTLRWARISPRKVTTRTSTGTFADARGPEDIRKPATATIAADATKNLLFIFFLFILDLCARSVFQ
ncbi:MAG: hypothetical protein ACKOL0_03100, partial [Solirubrobacterales bacterium]